MYLSSARSRLTCSQPSRALSSCDCSPSATSRWIQDQPSPILFQVTVPPLPVSPSALRAFSSPTFHLADFTNWNTPIGQPWFQARSAMPKAAVDFPCRRPCAPSPARGCGAGGWSDRRRERRSAVPAALSGPPGCLCCVSCLSCLYVPDEAGDRVGAQLVQRHGGAAEFARELPREPQPHRAGLAVHDDRRRALGGVQPPRGRRAPPVAGRAPPVARPSVTTTSSGRREGSRSRSTRSTSGP